MTAFDNERAAGRPGVPDEPQRRVDALEPAFPRDHKYDGHNGMTLRDYVAVRAFEGCLGAGMTATEAADYAFRSADVFLAARSAR
jgi:hypothetical protein